MLDGNERGGETGNGRGPAVGPCSLVQRVGAALGQAEHGGDAGVQRLEACGPVRLVVCDKAALQAAGQLGASSGRMPLEFFSAMAMLNVSRAERMRSEEVGWVMMVFLLFQFIRVERRLSCFSKAVVETFALRLRAEEHSPPLSAEKFYSSSFHNSRISGLVVRSSSSVPSDSTLPSFITIM